MTRIRAEIVSRSQEWGLQGIGQAAAGWPLSVLGGVWAEGGIHSHREEKCSQMAWEGPFSSMTTLPGSLGRSYGDRKLFNMRGPSQSWNLWRPLLCTEVQRDVAATYPSCFWNWLLGPHELFLLSYRGSKWRQTGWSRILEHGPNLDPDVPLKALPAGQMQSAALRASSTSHSWTEWESRGENRSGAVDMG